MEKSLKVIGRSYKSPDPFHLIERVQTRLHLHVQGETHNLIEKSTTVVVTLMSLGENISCHTL